MSHDEGSAVHYNEVEEIRHQLTSTDFPFYHTRIIVLRTDQCTSLIEINKKCRNIFTFLVEVIRDFCEKFFLFLLSASIEKLKIFII